jgi:hypothetical protein
VVEAGKLESYISNAQRAHEGRGRSVSIDGGGQTRAKGPPSLMEFNKPHDEERKCPPGE